MYDKIVKMIEDNQEEFAYNEAEVSYNMLNQKRLELVSLGLKIFQCYDDFFSYYKNLDYVEKFSIYTLAEWGYLSPPTFYGNVKIPKRLSDKPPKHRRNYYYKYLLHDGIIEKLIFCCAGKEYGKRYFCRTEDAIYSFKFNKGVATQRESVEIIEAKYKDGAVISYSNCIVVGIPNGEGEAFELCKENSVRNSMLDYQLYNYNEFGELVSIDFFERIYAFSPQIAGYEFGKRYVSIINEKGQQKFEKLQDYNICVFQPE